MLFWKLYIILCFSPILVWCNCTRLINGPLDKTVTINGVDVKVKLSGTETIRVCCRGYRLINKVCTPICTKGCENGNCVKPNKCECKIGYKFVSENTRNRCVPENGSCKVPGKCECNTGYRNSTTLNKCEPICKNDCVNGRCIAPDQCACNKGYKMNETNTCEPICKVPDKCQCEKGYEKSANNLTCTPMCERGCENGKCIAPNTCDCDKGYEMDSKQKCQPICKAGCANGKCIAPEVCKCNDQYEMSDDGNCDPICKNGCPNGQCIAPDNCVCLEGYTKLLTNSCLPVCAYGCPNGKCVAPEICKCNHGYAIFDNKCEPICQDECINAVCSAPNKCECKPGYFKTSNSSCSAICDRGCVNGVCVAPNDCICSTGYYKTSRKQGNVCEKIIPDRRQQKCLHNCFNGVCLDGLCSCPNNYLLRRFNSTDVCLPKCIQDKDCLNGLCSSDGVCRKQIALSLKTGQMWNSFITWFIIVPLVIFILVISVLAIMYWRSGRYSFSFRGIKNMFADRQMSQTHLISQQLNEDYPL